MTAVAMYPHATPGAFFDAACEYPQKVSGFKNEVLKVVIYCMKWMKELGYEFSPAALRVQTGFKDAKNLLGVPGLLEAMKGFKDHAYEVWTGRTEAATDVFFDAVRMVSPAKDLLSFASDKGVISLSPVAAAVINTVGNGALVIGPGRLAVQAGYKIADGYNSAAAARTDYDRVVGEAKAVKGWFELIRNISYVALGAIGLVATAFGITLQAWIPLACVTTALIASLGSYFHQRLSVLHRSVAVA